MELTVIEASVLSVIKKVEPLTMREIQRMARNRFRSAGDIINTVSALKDRGLITSSDTYPFEYRVTSEPTTYK